MSTSTFYELYYRLSTSGEVTSVDLDGERVLLDVQSGEYYGLNAMGTQIFEMAEKEPTIGEVVDTMQNANPTVNPEQIASDVSRFIEDMQSFGLLHVTEVSEAA